MANAEWASFSHENLDLDVIAQQYNDIEAAVRLYFSPACNAASARFATYTPAEIEVEMDVLLQELGRSTTMSILAALEAAFRIDYQRRCRKRMKDPLSRALRDIYRTKGMRASLEDEILGAWRANSSGGEQLASELRGALKYRHWLAHGRYWVPKLGQKYDYQDLYILADAILHSFPLEGP
jgi:hypothetical protein